LAALVEGVLSPGWNETKAMFAAEAVPQMQMTRMQHNAATIDDVNFIRQIPWQIEKSLIAPKTRLTRYIHGK
jgi:hypothetical protein